MTATEHIQALRSAFARGIEAFKPRKRISLDEWSREHFYLSAESSYVEQAWSPWPFQQCLMSIMSHDDVAEVTVKKSARIGYTKCLLAFIGYNAEHTRRNQCIWLPTDDDASDFVKSELDPMIRDVEVMRSVFPSYLARHKDNTLDAKKFLGSMLRIKGAKAAKNFRRISVDVAMGDEIDAMDGDVESEGDPLKLMAKRTEGATFPKNINGSTPKVKAFSLVEGRYQSADIRMSYQAPCPSCGEFHALTWGGKGEPHGFKFDGGKPETVKHLCPHCGVLHTQADWMEVEASGAMVSECGEIWLRPGDIEFTDRKGKRIDAPKHVALHVWTAYSPVVSWPAIVAEFMEAHEKQQEGRNEKMQAFTNTTLGLAHDGNTESLDADDLQQRGEPFKLQEVPRDCLLLLCGIDTQDNRLECGVWGYGLGGEMWTIDHHVIHGNPAQQQIWDEAEEWYRSTKYPHPSGKPMRIYAGAIDSGGHHADAVYAFSHKLKALRMHAVKGYNGRERSIDQSNSRVGYRWNGRIEKAGPVLWQVGTALAKDRMHSRLEVTEPGPGYVHLSDELTEEWFKQMAGQQRTVKRTPTGSVTKWTDKRKRIEVWDCATYTIWLEERLGLWRAGKKAMWEKLQAELSEEQDDSPPPPPKPKPAPRSQPAAQPGFSRRW